MRKKYRRHPAHSSILRAERLEGRMLLSAAGAQPASIQVPAQPVLTFTDKLLTMSLTNGGLAIADFNGDGKGDLIAHLSTTHEVRYYQGNGDGTFQNPVSTVLPSNSGGGYVTAADMDGDGKRDLLVIDSTNNAVFYLRGNGDGTFQPAISYPVGIGVGGPVAVGDFNGDGRMDFMTSNFTDKTVSVMLQSPTGVFQVVPPVSLGWQPISVAVGDFNKDGKTDAVAAGYGGNLITVLTSTGNGNFTQSSLSIPDSNTHAGLAVGDFNGDGYPDIVSSGPNTTWVSYFLNRANGAVLFTGPFSFSTGGYGSDFLANFTNDGRADLVVTPLDTTPSLGSIYLGSAGGLQFLPTANFIPPTSTNSAVGDLNGDGLSDIVTPKGLQLEVDLSNPLAAASAAQLQGEPTNATLAAFVDNARPSDPTTLAATITWGDGFTSPGTVVNDGSGAYHVAGTHTYAYNGAYTFKVTVVEPFGTQISVTGADAVTGAPGGASITEFPTGAAAGFPDFIVPGPSGNLWFNQNSGGSGTTVAGQVAPAGISTVFPAPVAANTPRPTASDASGNLWYVESDNMAAEVTPAGAVSQFSVPGLLVAGDAIARGPDGSIWFTDTTAPGAATPVGSIGHFAADGTFNLVSLSSPIKAVTSMTAGPDGNLWLTESGSLLARVGSDGAVTQFALPTFNGVSNYQARSITPGPDGNLWFTDQGVAGIGNISTGGVITQFPLLHGDPLSIAAGPDGNLWFTEYNANRIGRMTPTGQVSEYSVPSGNIVAVPGPNPTHASGAQPYGITAGSDGNVWFTESTANQVARVNLVAAPILTPAPALALRRKASFTGPVASFTDPTAGRLPADYLVTINWGDGTTTPGTITSANGVFTVSGTHTYNTEQTFTITVTVLPPVDVPISTFVSASVNDFPLSVTGKPTIFAVETQPTGTIPLLTFSDSDPNSLGADFTGTITWGDNTSSAATFGAGTLPGTWVINGNHTYQTDGHLPVHIHVNDVGGSVLDADTIAAIGDPLSLTAPINYVGGAQAVLVTDVNGDGIPDMITGWVSAITVRLGVGDGSFGSPINSSLASSGVVTGLVKGDFNGDGKIDILYTVTPSSIRTGIMLGNGNGTFTPAPDIFAASTSVATADFNGDGNLDAVANGGATGVNILNGHGDGTFPVSTIALPDSSPRGPVVTGDFNGDGKKDIAVISYMAAAPNTTTLLEVLMGNGNGIFQPAVVYTLAPNVAGGGSFSLLAGDLNGDGKTDLLALDPIGNKLDTLLNNGTGVFTLTTAILESPAPANLRAQFPALGDVNRDGIPDLVVPEVNDGSLHIRLGRGDGTFMTDLLLPGIQPFAVASEDFNADGAADLAVVQSNNNAVRVLLNTPVTATPAVVSAVEGAAPASLTVATFTNEDAPGLPGDYSASIDWGDGSQSPGVIVLQNGTFQVKAAKFYVEDGTYSATVTIRGAHGILAIATVPVTVADTALTGLATPISVVAGAPFTAVVATFTDASPYGKLSDFTAQIVWGDGNTSVGIVSADGNGGYTVIGSNTFAAAGNFSAKVTITDAGGKTTIVTVPITAAANAFGGGLISGHVFNDLSADGVREVGEPPLFGATVFLDANGNGILDPGEKNVLSDVTGAYALADIPEGAWVVRMLPAAGYQITTPADNSGVPATLIRGQLLDGVNLGAARLTTDVVGRSVFYNHSYLDNGTPGASRADDNAIGADKQALRPGHAVTAANSTSYDKGINGVMVDISNVPGIPTAADFVFTVGNAPNTAGTMTAPPPSSVILRVLTGNVTRITLIWPDFSIVGQWLQIMVKANANTGLASPDVFSFGNAPAPDGDSPAAPILLSAQVNDGSAQRSIVKTYALHFDHAVTLAAGAVTLTRLNTGGSGLNDGSAPTDVSAGLSFSTPDGGLTWVVTFAGSAGADAFGSLADGIYSLTIHSTLIGDVAGNPLGGGNQTFTFLRLFGDFNGDGRVNGADYLQFTRAFGSKTGDANYLGLFDLNHDGRVNSSDYFQFGNRFGKALFLPV